MDTNPWLSINNIYNLVALDLEKQMHYKVVSHQSDIGKTYLYAKDPYETKHKLLINKKKV